LKIEEQKNCIADDAWLVKKLKPDRWTAVSNP
jgi:hypothetical protein